MPCTLPFECYLQYLKLGVVNDKYHTTIISIIGWCCCLNIVIESKDDAPNEAANASLFDYLLHPSQQTMQNAVT